MTRLPFFRSVARLAVAAGLLMSAGILTTAAAGESEAVSFESFNLQDHFIRHRFSMGIVSAIFTDLDRADSQWVVRAGLSGTPGSVSFESVNFPGHFLRHQNYRLKLGRDNGTELFGKDASFLRRGPASRSRFESVNFPDHFIRHRDGELWLDKNNGSPLFSRDSLFEQKPAPQS
jgi:hypothetical protein